MKGRKPGEYRLNPADRRVLQEVTRQGQLCQRVTLRARAVLALDRGERFGEVGHWLGLSRMALWYLWQRYQQRGVAAIFDAPRPGRPRVFSLAAPGPDHPHRLYRASHLRVAPAPLGLSQPAAGGGGTRDRALHPLDDRGPHSGPGQFAAPSQAVLEDRPAG